jgi:biotin carboxylase
MSRVLLLATTTGYQARAFREAAERRGIELVLATDRCHVLEDPWRDGAVPVRFHDEPSSLAAIVEAARSRPLDGVLALGDRPTILAALAAEALDLPGHSPGAARVAANKLRTREALRDAGLPVPWFRSVSLDENPADLAGDVEYPCVVKPLSLSGSRGVIRANDPEELVAAIARVARLLRRTEIRALRDPAHDRIIVEGFIPGEEFAVEGLVDHGVLSVLGIFDKPEPLDGPFFEETIYVTPSTASAARQAGIVRALREAVRALGLRHGPVHAECRTNDGEEYVLEVAARPIGGLCARALRFEGLGPGPLPLEELLLAHAARESVTNARREAAASGVMMMPISRAGYYRGVEGVDEARSVPYIDDLLVTAKPDQLMEPLPEGSSYLGFVFARAPEPGAVERALREAFAKLRFVIAAPVPVA